MSGGNFPDGKCRGEGKCRGGQMSGGGGQMSGGQMSWTRLIVCLWGGVGCEVGLHLMEPVVILVIASWEWCSGGGATGAIAPVPIFQGGASLQFLFHLFLVNFAYILQKLSFDSDYYW